MPLVRLFRAGGEPSHNVIEDLEMAAAPMVGDVFEITYPPDSKVSYKVVSRRFIVSFAAASGENREPLLALEVESSETKQPFSWEGAL